MEVKEKIRNDFEKYGFVVFAFSDAKDGENIELVAFSDSQLACGVFDHKEDAFPEAKALKIEYIPYLDLKKAAFADNCTGFGIATEKGYLFRVEKEPLSLFSGFINTWFRLTSSGQKGTSEEKADVKWT